MKIYLLFLFLLGMINGFSQGRTGQDRALLFAVDDYTQMTDLNNPIQNARDIATELKDRYGFAVEVVSNPKFQDIEAKIQEYQQAYRSGRYNQDGQLFIFFSGHGVKRGNNGYFMPADADPNRPYALGMEYDYWRSEINNIDCKHILVAIDACHSIAFDPRWENKPDRQFFRKGEQYADQILLNHQQYRARLFYTSDAVGDQTPDRSTFARQLLEGLRTYRSNTGYLTSSELFASYLRKAAPTPGGGDFGSDDPGSCFLFFRQVNTYPVDARADRIAWQQAKQTNTAAAYRQYLLDFPSGEFRPLVQQELNILEAETREQRAWETTKTMNTPEAYKDFIDQYPNSIYRELAELSKGKFQSSSTTTEAKRPPDNMVLVKGGTFQMGSNDGDNDEKPAHPVTLSDFYIGRFEVTVEDFSRFVQATNYQTDAEKWGYLRHSFVHEGSKLVKKYAINWRYDEVGNIRPSSQYKHPVIHVTWNDAVAYCNWLSKKHRYEPVYTINGSHVTVNRNANGYRLPTEAEWEFSARSQDGNDKWAGTSLGNELSSYANYWESEAVDKDGYEYTAPVGSFEANNLGLHDMSGNVWEWCWDWQNTYSSNAQTNPTGPERGSSRVLRGGSWNYLAVNLRCTYRFYKKQDYRDDNIGFRLCRSAP